MTRSGRVLAAALAAALVVAQEPVIRISVTLVQIDAVVTDRNGRAVTDLTRDDFEILQDGKPQKIVNFSWIDTAAGLPIAVPDPAAAPAAVPVGRPAVVRPEQIRRTVALVVDDLGLSYPSIARAREALRKFVDTKLAPGDLTAVIRTGAGMGALQNFTTDKRQLHAAIDGVRWNFVGRAGISAFRPIVDSLLSSSDNPAVAEMEEASARLDEFSDEVFSVGTLGAVNYVVRALRELPGRKSVVLISDGFRLIDREGRRSRITDAMERLADLANRAAVVIYSLDARGLDSLTLTAEDSVASPRRVAAGLQARRQDNFDLQDGLNYLATETGGLFFRDSNDIAGDLGRMLDDQRGYYLLGYNPGSATFNRAFHKIRVRVKRPGLSVRSRKGFFGVPDGEVRPSQRTPAGRLSAAISSPFASGDVRLKLTSLFVNEAKSGSFVHSFLHLDGRDLTFADEPEGWKRTTLEALIISYGDKGAEISRTHHPFHLRVRNNTFESVRTHGLLYNITHPIKKGGVFQLRAAIVDTASGRVGSAHQFIEVPDLAKNRLALSGVFLRSTTGGDLVAEGQVDMSDPKGNPAIRVFTPGKQLLYAYQILNAKQKDRKPHLTTRVRMFRDGKLVWDSPPSQVSLPEKFDVKRLAAGGQLRLGTGTTPGEYLLQVEVVDRLAGKRGQTAAQWIDFELVR